MLRQTRAGTTFNPYPLPIDLSALSVVRSGVDSVGLFRAAALREDEDTSDVTGDTSDVTGLNSVEDPATRPPTPLDEDLYPDIVGTFGTPDAANADTPGASGSSQPPPLNSGPNDSRRHPGQHRRRALSRKAAAVGKKDSRSTSTQPVKKSTLRKHVEKMDRISVAMDAVALPHSGGGSWIGRRGGDERKVWTVEELVKEEGFTLVKYKPGHNTVVVDEKDRMIAAIIDKPTQSDWSAVVDEAARCLRTVRRTGLEHKVFNEEDVNTRRGSFLQVPVGVSFGGGQKRPGNLFHHIRARRLIAQSILRNRAIRRIAGVQSSAFAFLNPKLFHRYSTDINTLFERQPELIRNFSNSAFPAASFNCGPTSVSFGHHDFNNLSFGLCALTPLGNFDYTRGGHLILFELKLVLEFPAGSTGLVPSSALRHGNTGIQPGEDRLSIAQYGAGGLFRWVAYDFCSGKSLDSTPAGRIYRVAVDGEPNERWLDGLNLYSTPDSLMSDHAELSASV